MAIRGWLFDTYAVGDKMVSWIRGTDSVNRIEERWTPSIYVASDDRSKLVSLPYDNKISSYIDKAELVEKFEKVSDPEKTKVLQIKLKDSSRMIRLAKTIESLEKFGTYRLYNVDVPPAQTYFYEKDIFPLGQFSVSENIWTANDNVELTDYSLPDFRKVKLKVNAAKQGKLAKFTDTIESIEINRTRLESASEPDLILEFVDTIRKRDPDFILTENGDSFCFPYLIERAKHNGILDRLVVGRDNFPLFQPRSKGTSYFSYGQIYFKPSGIKLHGRIHIDENSCFIWNCDDDIHGIYEIARLCRMPVQTAARASIGKCMSSLQFYKAIKRGLLVPWKPVMAEAFKSRNELMIADRGGLIFEPEVGVHQDVLQLDFTSLYGIIMFKKNISAETVLCRCCPDSDNRVPELDYNICRRTGIVPESLEILLQKRELYSELLKRFPENKIYDARTTALKWILVTSFGYLGFNNAKFGRIDAHIAVCAFARKILSDAFKVAEDYGFKVLHGIVDSLWLYKQGATADDYKEVKKKIEEKTEFETSIDIYKWIVFLPSKEHETVPVANRYFGAFRDGKLKIRGIELRRHDTPLYFKRCQLEMLNLMATAGSISQVKEMMPQIIRIYEKYRKKLEDQDVITEELAFTTRASKDVEDYPVNSVQKDAMEQLKEEGESVKAGQKIQYIITGYSRKTNRSAPLKMAGNKYDVKRYTKLLAECCTTVTKPFGTEITPER